GAGRVGPRTAYHAIGGDGELQLLPQAGSLCSQLYIDAAEVQVALPGIDTRIGRSDELVGRINGRRTLERMVLENKVHGKPKENHEKEEGIILSKNEPKVLHALGVFYFALYALSGRRYVSLLTA